MEPEETLAEEVRHDAKVRSEVVIGGLVLLVVVLGGVITYMAIHPPRAGIPGDQTATTTPSGLPSDGGAETITESKAYYYIEASYPRSAGLSETAGASADAEAAATMKRFVEGSIASFKRDGNFDNLSQNDVEVTGLGERRESLEIKYKVHATPSTVSFVYTTYADTLGAHPNAYFRTFTFDRKTGRSLTTGDVFAPGTNYLSILSQQSRKLLPVLIAEREGVSVAELDADYMNRGTGPDAENFKNWYLENGALTLIFPPYQVAPYAAGVLTISIPLSQLPTINATYK